MDDLIEAAAARWKSRDAYHTPDSGYAEHSQISSLTGEEFGRKSPILLELSEISREVLAMRSVRRLRVVMIALAVVCLTIVTSSDTLRAHDQHGDAVPVLHLVVDCYFIIDGSVRLLSSYCLPSLSKVSVRRVLERARRTGLVDIGLSLLVLVLSTSQEGVMATNWLRLLRVGLVGVYFMSDSPHMCALLGCVWTGMRALEASLVLLLAACLVHASLGTMLFRLNDPLHFGSLPAALFTSLSMATLDEWSEVLYINFHGCAHYPSVYQDASGATDAFVLRNGKMMLPVCSHSQARPVLAVLVLLPFTVLCGFLLLHAAIAGVAAAASASFAALAADTAGAAGAAKESKSAEVAGGGPRLPPPPTLLTSPKLLRELLRQVWREMDFYSSGPQNKRSRYYAGGTHTETLTPPGDGSGSGGGAHNSGSGESTPLPRAGWRYRLGPLLRLPPLPDSDAVSLAVFARSLRLHRLYRAGVTVAVLTSALLELYCIEHDDTPSAAVASTVRSFDILQSLLQFLFSFHLLVRLWASYPQPRLLFIASPTGLLDAAVLLFSWVEVFSFWAGSTLRVLGVFRVLRVAHLLSFQDVVSRSLSASARTLGRVLLLGCLGVFHAAVAGVLLFGRNDPVHFCSLPRALVTAVQVASLDGWTGLAYTNMIGCDHFGYSSADSAASAAACESPEGLGWLAAAYFLAVVLAALLLCLALLLAVLMFSLSLVGGRDVVVQREAERREVRSQQHDHRISDSAVQSCRDLFSLLVEEQNTSRRRRISKDSSKDSSSCSSSGSSSNSSSSNSSSSSSSSSSGGNASSKVMDNITFSSVYILFKTTELSNNEQHLHLLFCQADKLMLESLDFPGFLHFMFLAGRHVVAYQNSPVGAARRQSGCVAPQRSKSSSSVGGHDRARGRTLPRSGSTGSLGQPRGSQHQQAQQRGQSEEQQALDAAWSNKDRFALTTLKEKFHNEYLDNSVSGSSGSGSGRGAVKLGRPGTHTNRSGSVSGSVYASNDSRSGDVTLSRPDSGINRMASRGDLVSVSYVDVDGVDSSVGDDSSSSCGNNHCSRVVPFEVAMSQGGFSRSDDGSDGSGNGSGARGRGAGRGDEKSLSRLIHKLSAQASSFGARSAQSSNNNNISSSSSSNKSHMRKQQQQQQEGSQQPGKQPSATRPSDHTSSRLPRTASCSSLGQGERGSRSDSGITRGRSDDGRPGPE